ncbi:MAG: leucine-rich repeat domain-containing protein, partial [Paludibacteraceae bacterium]|nr:leucine-rich repeat domain-containing protein [Paludibacteraceae bacterium]
MANQHTESDQKTIFNKKFILTITIFAIIIFILHHFISTQSPKERTYRIISENNGTYLIDPSGEPSIFTMNIFELINHFSNTPIDKEKFCTSNIRHISLPNTLQSIPNDAFAGCSSLQTINIPNSVESIGEDAFAGCSSIKEINIPNSVKSIGEDAFAGCSSLQTISIPNSVKSIGEYAFAGCSSLQTINIPNSVKSIGEYA